MQIAIDGPSGSGKSTAARMVADLLGIPYLNTGQLYRAIAWLMIHVYGYDVYNALLATIIARQARLAIENGFVIKINGYNVRGKLDTPEIDAGSSAVSAHPGVRRALLAWQHDYATEHGVVMEGRDIGTVVLPNAELKIFLDCRPEARARRRAGENPDQTVEAALAAIVERDHNDATRNESPAIPAEDAIVIDSSDMTLQEVVDLIVGMARKADLSN